MITKRLNKTASLLAMLASLFIATSVIAADVAAGKTKSAVCAGCHGVAGVSAIPTFPNLAGQNALYTAKQIKAFRDKTRVDPTMNNIVANLTDADIANLAAYYESLK